MSRIGEKNWLSILPVTGYCITVFLKNGNPRTQRAEQSSHDGKAYTVPWGRISADGKTVHVGIILEPAEKGRYPSIAQTLEIRESDISEITLKEERDSREFISLKKPDTGWLNNLPKSRKCHIFLLCENRDDCKEIHKGWIEYDDRNIYLTEIIREMKVLEIERHDRALNGVIAILISVDSQTPQIFVRTTPS